MPISVRCECGKQWEVEHVQHGERVTCPLCARETAVPPEQPRAYDAFISYAAIDKKVADAMCATLEREGVRCWIAPRDVRPGTEWGAAIIEGINQCRLFVLVFSAASNNSPQCRREVERAVHKGLIILPFRTQDAPMSESMEYFLSSPQWIDATTPPLQKHLQELVGTVKRLSKEDRGVVWTRKVTDSRGLNNIGMDTSGQRTRRLAVCVSIALAAVLMVGGAALLLWPRTGGRPGAASITVTVTFKGMPVEGATVIFSPREAGDQGPMHAITDPEGRAQVRPSRPGDRAIPGSYVVTVIKPRSAGANIPEDMQFAKMATGQSGAPKTQPENVLPGKYAFQETSGLTARVASGENNFRFDLTD